RQRLLRLARPATEGIQLIGERIVFGHSTRLTGELMRRNRGHSDHDHQQAPGGHETPRAEPVQARARGADGR
ncbi:MAG: hypothetical protein DWI03_07955, partial [Planctomycetota bacterium]